MSKNWYLCGESSGKFIHAGQSCNSSNKPTTLYTEHKEVVDFITDNSPLVWRCEDEIDDANLVEVGL